MTRVKSLRIWIALMCVFLLGMTCTWSVLAEGEGENNTLYTLHSEAVGASEMKLWLEVDTSQSIGITAYQMKLQLSAKGEQPFSATNVDFNFSAADKNAVLMNWAKYDENSKVLTLYAAANTDLVSYQEEGQFSKLDLGTVKIKGMKNTQYQITVPQQGLNIVDLTTTEIPVSSNNIHIADTDYSGSTDEDDGDTENPGGDTSNPGGDTSQTPDDSTEESRPNPPGDINSTPGDSEQSKPSDNQNTSKPSDNQNNNTSSNNQNQNDNTSSNNQNNASNNPSTNRPNSNGQNQSTGGSTRPSNQGGNQSTQPNARPSQNGSVTVQKPTMEANVEDNSSQDADQQTSSKDTSDNVSSKDDSSKPTSAEQNESKAPSNNDNSEKNNSKLPIILIVIGAIIVLGLGVGAVALKKKN